MLELDSTKHSSHANGSDSLSSKHRVQLDKFVELIKKWDRVHSLVSKRDLNYLHQRHVEDSLALVPFLKPSGTHLDIGSGAGFPGVPLAIGRPDVRVVLNDRSANKCRFLREVKYRLQLTSVEVLESDIGNRNQPQRQFDTISMRAVAPPAKAWALARALIHARGLVLLHTPEQFPKHSVEFEQGIVHSCTPSVRGWITAIAKSAS